MMWLKRVSALALLTSLANVAAIKSGLQRHRRRRRQ
jgi:hypothetical protein